MTDETHNRSAVSSVVNDSPAVINVGHKYGLLVLGFNYVTELSVFSFQKKKGKSTSV